ncbi:MAG TPA: LysR family transcriptional regulator [Polyangiales bacterium]
MTVLRLRNAEEYGVKLDWDDLRFFLTTVQSGSLRSAARELGVDVSTVSRRLSQLEQAAGTRLLRRSSRRLEITAAGTQVLGTGEQIAREVHGLARKIASVDPRLGGMVRVTAPGSLTPLLGEAVLALRASHPQIEIELLSLDALLPLESSQVDVAVRIAEAPPEHLVGARICRLRAAVYASATYLARQRASLHDPAHAWVEWDRRLAGKPGMQWLSEQFPNRRVVARGLSTLDVLALVRAGVGVAALPRLVGDREPNLRRLEEVPDSVASSIWLLTHPDLQKLPRVRVVLAAIKRVLVAHKSAL